MNEIRLLRPEDIEVRVQSVKKTSQGNGAILLLYKDARVDMNILDEWVGPMNWQRSHSRDNANCIVSIWDKEKETWVSKEDTGTESFTEKEKGLASDSFKRACFNWGIGRELYTSPFVWVNIDDSEMNGEKLKPNVKFFVKDIGYDDNRNINRLIIGDGKGVVRFVHGSKAQDLTSKKTEAKAEVKGNKSYTDCMRLAKSKKIDKAEVLAIWKDLYGDEANSKNGIQAEKVYEKLKSMADFSGTPLG